MTEPKLRDIAEQLLALARDEESRPQIVAKPDAMQLARLAEALHSNRSARADEFPSSFFGEPAWDMLLHLFVEDQYGREVLVKHACLAANAPETTAIRFINLLEAEGFARRRPDPSDRRRLYVDLTGKGRDAMTRSLTRTFRVFRHFSQD